MKKSTLALSVAAALGGLGFSASSFAMTDMVAPGAGTVLQRNADGIGHQLIVPYFTAQSDNATLLELTNHDLTNGKLVKVRFRGASNSDDLYDFTLAMSPGDVWTAAVSKDAATGLAKLVSADASCVLPATAKNGLFVTTRLDQTLTGDALNAQTREGYVEVITMADIPPAAGGAGVDTLYEAVKHVNKVAPCTPAILDASLGTDVNNAGAAARGLAAPTGLLSGDWIIINQSNTAAWSGAATALQVVNGAGANAAGALVFWPQKASDITGVVKAEVTADPLLNFAAATPVKAQWYDLPDLSTPYVVGDWVGGPPAVATAATRADATTLLLAVKSLSHQIVTTSDIAAVTDVVFSQPTRRYHAAMNYKATAATDDNTASTGALASINYRAGSAYYFGANTDPINRQVCVVNVTAPVGQNVLFDREETTPGAGTTDFVISPNLPATPTVLQLCGETSVVSINQGGVANASSAVSGSVARTDITVGAGYEAGWVKWDLTAAGANANGLPVLANTFIRARNGAVNYGFAWPAKVTR